MTAAVWRSLSHVKPLRARSVPWRGFGALGICMAIALSACASLPDTTDASTRARGPVYKPGQSIAEARLCSCTQCAEPSCCSGEKEPSTEEPSFGISLSSCSRCTRRIWTARGDAACSELAGAECCAGTISN